ncbi:HAMP domain-containing sensor histidine kinase [Pseudofrankia sp. BMG5.37]|uniref:sensor histidine kinase n=1 Tax=Pseudofrankia sp. BMG5.37 TaxID=3050035 RepID=UPI00289519B1|nr:HAMP domain-containing sensor histidine kinase [Pseudofrankia sp. BMG5.37]MDT3439162.1 HAMP domain-containing sensor histidine kinase [Pseudofrankia sp. BMG5.37]
MIALSLVVAGSFTLVVNTFAFRNVPYPSVYSFHSALMAEMGVRQETGLSYIEAHPEQLFSTKFDDTRLRNGKTVDEVAREVQQRRLDQALGNARRWSFVGLLVVLVGAVATAWMLSGSILRPIRKMTDRARSASASDLGDRVSIDGPDDEVKELADTFDAMLDRLSVAFVAQRRFAGQVAHELRTPLATSRAELAMLLDDTADADVQRRLRTVSEAVDRSQRLVSQLLVLSRTDLNDLEKTTFPLDELVGNVLGRVVETPSFTRIRLDVDLRTAEVACDRALLESLARNLLDNSARHNRPDGWVTVTVAPGDDGRTASLCVANSVPDLTDDTESVPGRPGVGLSIVQAVLQAHGGTIRWSRRPGEVTARVELPLAVS